MQVQAHHFRCYIDLDITLPVGLTLIDGVNKDESGNSNSAGKTSLLDAIFWARYGWLPLWEGSTPKNGTVDSVIHRGQKSCWVRITEKVGNSEISYERRRPSKLYCWKDGAVQQWSQADLERELGGVGPEQFLVGCLLAQSDARCSFWSMGEVERMRLISVAAGQEKAQKAYAAAKVKKDGIKPEVDKLEGAENALKAQKLLLPDITAVQSKIAALEEELKSAVETFQNYHELSFEIIRDADSNFKSSLESATKDAEDKILPLKAACEQLEATIVDLNSQFNQCAGGRDLHAEVLVTDLKQALSAAEELNRLIDVHNRSVDRIESSNEHIEKMFAFHADNAEKSLTGACSTCQQPLTEEQRKKNVEFHLAAAELTQKDLKEVPARQEKIDNTDIQKKLTEAQAALTARQFELSAKPKALIQEKALAESRLREHRGLIRQVESERDRILDQFKRTNNSTIEATHRMLRDLDTNANGIKQKVEGAREALVSVGAQAASLQSSLVDTSSKLDVARASLDEALDLMELFGPSGWPSVEFEGFVQRVSDRAGDLVSRITNGIYSTKLEQAGLDGDGNQKTVLRPVVTCGGAEVPADDPSGAKEAALKLGYDIAIAEAAGKDLPLFLDEALEGMSPMTKESAMEILSEVSGGRPVFVVDHATEFKSAFANVLTVVKENGVSCIVEN
jgi:DNA repair exonuclease SbcCD ATPase subunit